MKRRHHRARHQAHAGERAPRQAAEAAGLIVEARSSKDIPSPRGKTLNSTSMVGALPCTTGKLRV